MDGQDITPPERVRADPKCDREVTVYGYARGCNLKPGARVHLAGVGDYPVRPCFSAPAPQAGPVRVTYHSVTNTDQCTVTEPGYASKRSS